MMHDTDLAVERLKALKNLGVRMALDDFGTGYSSLSYLSKFPIDILKMDRSFLQAGRADSGLAAAIVSLGETLDLQVVAEGIEMPEQLSSLLNLGCELGQGFLFAKAMPLPSVVEYLGSAAADDDRRPTRPIAPSAMQHSYDALDRPGGFSRVNLLHPLRHRRFLLLWSGMTVSLFGDGIFLVAMAWQVYELWNAPAALSVVGIAMTVPTIACLLPGGVVSDRLDRRTVMLAADAPASGRDRPAGGALRDGRAHAVGARASCAPSTASGRRSSTRRSTRSCPTSFRPTSWRPPTRSTSSSGRWRCASPARPPRAG